MAVREEVEQEIQLLRELSAAHCPGVVKLITYEEDQSAMFVATEKFAASLSDAVLTAPKCGEQDIGSPGEWSRRRSWAHDLIKAVSGLHHTISEVFLSEVQNRG